MAYVNPSTFVAGEVGTAAEQNVIANDIRFLHGPPTCQVRRVAAQSIGSGGYVSIQFDTEGWDTNTIWSSTASEKLFARTAGKYLATFTAHLAGSSAGQLRIATIAKNTTAVGSSSTAYETRLSSTAIGSNGIGLSVSGMFSLTTSDYLTANVYQDSGISFNTSTGAANRLFHPTMSMLWVSS